MIFGVTGYYGSGKDEFAKFLENEEFIHLSLSDEIRKELKKKRKRKTRKNLIDMGNEIRRNQGPSELAKRVLKKVKENKDYVLTSIRNKEEVLELKKRKDFVLVNVIAPVELRFDRLISRGRKGDPITFEEFIQKERLEQSEISTDQQLHIVTGMADIVINNNKDLDMFHMKIDRLLADWYPKFHQQ